MAAVMTCNPRENSLIQSSKSSAVLFLPQNGTTIAVLRIKTNKNGFFGEFFSGSTFPSFLASENGVVEGNHGSSREVWWRCIITHVWINITSSVIANRNNNSKSHHNNENTLKQVNNKCKSQQFIENLSSSYSESGSFEETTSIRFLKGYNITDK